MLEQRVGLQQPACCLESLIFLSDAPPRPRWLPQAKGSQSQVGCESSQVAPTVPGRAAYLGGWPSFSYRGLRGSAPNRRPLLRHPHRPGLGPPQVNDVMRKESRMKGH